MAERARQEVTPGQALGILAAMIGVALVATGVVVLAGWAWAAVVVGAVSLVYGVALVVADGSR